MIMALKIRFFRASLPPAVIAIMPEISENLKKCFCNKIIFFYEL